MYSLQVRPCISQPRNFTGWGNDGVNGAPKAPLFFHAENIKQISALMCAALFFRAHHPRTLCPPVKSCALSRVKVKGWMALSS